MKQKNPDIVRSMSKEKAAWWIVVKCQYFKLYLVYITSTQMPLHIMWFHYSDRSLWTRYVKRINYWIKDSLWSLVFESLSLNNIDVTVAGKVLRQTVAGFTHCLVITWLMFCVFCYFLCVCFCTGHLTYLHCLQPFFFEHIFYLYYCFPHTYAILALCRDCYMLARLRV